MAKKSKKQETLTIRVPRDAWELICETLALDAKSKAFDPALREKLVAAMRQVHDAGEPYLLVTVYAGVPDKMKVFWDEKEALRAAREQVKSLRPDYDALVVRQGDVEVYGWPEKD